MKAIDRAYAHAARAAMQTLRPLAGAFLACCALLAADTRVLDRDFYAALAAREAVGRDFFLDENLNGIIHGKGYVDAMGESTRFHRKYRISIISTMVTGLNIVYYIHTDNASYMKLLKKKDLFEFKGQFVIYTPLSSRRDSYIFDIILEEGAVVLE